MQFHEEWVLDGGYENIENNNPVELYNLKNDIGETSNLCTTEVEKRNELLHDLLMNYVRQNTKADFRVRPNIWKWPNGVLQNSKNGEFNPPTMELIFNISRMNIPKFYRLVKLFTQTEKPPKNLNSQMIICRAPTHLPER